MNLLYEHEAEYIKSFRSFYIPKFLGYSFHNSDSLEVISYKNVNWLVEPNKEKQVWKL